MANSLSLLGQQVGAIWREFGVRQKFGTIMGLLIVVSAIGALAYWSSRPDYRLLYAGLSLKDAAAVREKLDEEKIPCRLGDGGQALFVPAGDVYRGRLLLAAEGLPKDTSAGFELFEQPKFGLTDFAQQVNYQRALQGELERTIRAMHGIEQARVMLVLPKERLFASQATAKPTASILVTVRRDQAMAPAQVQSVVQLVASSVPGLKAEDVTVSDQTGRLLTRSVAADEGMAQSSDQLAVQEHLETALARKAQDILDKSLGPDKSLVRVTAGLDFSKIQKRVESYDSANRVVRTETIESESSENRGAGGGAAAGVVANVPVGNPAAGAADAGLSKNKKENIRTEYAIPSDVQQIVQNGLRITSLSVSVCVAKGAAARDAQAIKNIEELVRNAVGFTDTAQRKDSIKVSEVEFPTAAAPVPETWWAKLPVRPETLGQGAMAAGALLILYLISRRVLSSLTVQHEAAGVPVAALDREGGVGESSAPIEEGDLGRMRRLSEQNPKAVAAWINYVTTQEG
jgi:flagellar M-ring protein FliF